MRPGRPGPLDGRRPVADTATACRAAARMVEGAGLLETVTGIVASGRAPVGLRGEGPRVETDRARPSLASVAAPAWRLRVPGGLALHVGALPPGVARPLDGRVVAGPVVHV